MTVDGTRIRHRSGHRTIDGTTRTTIRERSDPVEGTVVVSGMLMPRPIHRPRRTVVGGIVATRGGRVPVIGSAGPVVGGTRSAGIHLLLRRLVRRPVQGIVVVVVVAVGDWWTIEDDGRRVFFIF